MPHTHSIMPWNTWLWIAFSPSEICTAITSVVLAARCSSTQALWGRLWKAPRFMPSICEAEHQLSLKNSCSPNAMCTCHSRGEHTAIDDREAAAHCPASVQLFLCRLYSGRVGNMLVVYNVLPYGKRIFERSPWCTCTTTVICAPSLGIGSHGTVMESELSSVRQILWK